MYRGLSVVVASGLLVSCSVLDVSKQTGAAKKVDVDGIPFYRKIETQKRTTIYVQTWLQAALTIKTTISQKTGDKTKSDTSVRVITLNLPKSKLDTLNAIKHKISINNGNDESVSKSIIEDFEKLQSDELKSDDYSKIKEEVISNKKEFVWVVDASTTYYLNANMPWFGSSTINQELNTDGTLSKASGSADSKLADAITSFIPLKDFLSARFITTSTSSSSTPSKDSNGKFRLLLQKTVTTTETELSISIDENGYEYTFTSDVNSEGSPKTIPFVLKDAEFTRKEVGAKKSEGDKGDGQKVGVSGSINFPKDWGSSPKAKEE